MALATFIVQNLDEIIEEWVDFARTLEVSEGLDLAALRDHARQMLVTIANEMMSEQTNAEQKTKSRGAAPRDTQGETSAETHGDQRYAQGFKLEELVSEYRALRATVIRLWISRESLDERTLYELTRFNEGIDQLLAESVLRFSKQLDRARQLFMGVLGHDLRTDLHVILASCDRLQRTPSPKQIEEYVPHIRSSAHHILSMVEDLLDVTRTHFGAQLPIECIETDAASSCAAVLAPFQQLHKSCDIRLHVEGDVVGRWDQRRLEQMLANLVRNAFQHGDIHRAITLSAHGKDDEVVFKVHNYGHPIPQALIGRIFEPMQQGHIDNRTRSLGLGLYIARAIVEAHQGTIGVTSSELEGTTFTARLPRGRCRD